jgi:hypothetical protein
MTPRVIWQPLLFAIPLIALLAGCGSGARGTAVGGNFTLAEARNFTGYAVYSAGPSVEGLPLTHIGRWITSIDLTTFSYGTCTPRGPEGGCPVPISVASSSYCARPLDRTSHGPGDGSVFDFKGAQAEWVGSSLVLHFRDSTVNIEAAMADGRSVDVELYVASQLVAENASVIAGSRSQVSEDFGPVTATCR